MKATITRCKSSEKPMQELMVFYGRSDAGEDASAWDARTNIGVYGPGAGTVMVEAASGGGTLYLRLATAEDEARVWAPETVSVELVTF